MSDRAEFEAEAPLRAAYEGALRWLDSLGSRSAYPAERGVLGATPLPEEGIGDVAALEDLWSLAESRASASSGPRFFHYVVGGTTPAALAADWAASALDQVASSRSGSPLAVDLEHAATQWVLDLVGLGGREPGFTGLLTSGATAANLVGLGAARQWWAEQHGVDAADKGLFGLPRPRVLASGRVHASVEKALAILGLGRRCIERISSANDGALDVEAFRRACAELGGQPAIVVATAGCADAGGFDPIADMADACDAHGLWLHVDGAFGLFAGALGSERHRVQGVDRARSIAADAHKWLNVPYDAGIVYLRERSFAAKTFRQRAAYLPPARGGAQRLVPANLVPESSRRARALPLYAALLAHGARGYREHFERSFALARALAARVRTSDALELVGEPESVVVPFRCAPAGLRKRDLDALNQDVAERVESEGRVAVGTTRYRSVVCFRPAIVGWRTRERHVEELVEAVERALAAALAGQD